MNSPPAMPEITHAVGDDRCASGGVAFVPVGEHLVPDRLARLHVERDQMVVDRDAKELAVVDGRRAPVDRTEIATRCTPGSTSTGVRQICLPVSHVDGKRPLAVHDVHDAVVDRRRAQFAHVIHQARVPDRHEALDVRLVDLLKRAVVLAVVAHACGRHVVGVPAVVRKFGRGLGECHHGADGQGGRQQASGLHIGPRSVVTFAKSPLRVRW